MAKASAAQEKLALRQLEAEDRRSTGQEEFADEPNLSNKDLWTTGTFELEDDGMTPEKLNWALRLNLRPPNSSPKTWWTREHLPDTSVKVVRGVSLFSGHIAGKSRILNTGVITLLHRRENFVHYSEY